MSVFRLRASSTTRLLIAGSLRTMRRYWLRTFFMGLGVAAGVATLVASRSLGIGSEQAMLDKVDRMFGPSSLMIMARGTNTGGRRGPATTFTLADLEAIEERLPQIVAWDPMIIVGGRELKVAGQNRQVTIYGHSERALEVWNRGVVEGRSFITEDSARAARVALIGTRIAAELFAEDSPIDRQILLGGAPFRVVGVLEPIGIDPHGMDRDQDVHVPTTTAMRRLLNVDYITSAKLVASDPQAVEETADQIEELLRRRHGIAAGEPADFAIFTPRFVGRMIARSKRVLKVFVPAGAGVVLLVTAMVISTVMLIAVRERFAEIGLRKAVGATEEQIGFQFLIEALGVTLAAGLLGLALGAAAVAAVAHRMQLPAVITADSLVLGLAAAVAVGVVSGLLPARRAARLDPVRALR